MKAKKRRLKIKCFCLGPDNAVDYDADDQRNSKKVTFRIMTEHLCMRITYLVLKDIKSKVEHPNSATYQKILLLKFYF